MASRQSSPEKPISQSSHDQLSSPFWRIRREAKEETVDLKSLPAAIQHTIKEKAAGRKILRAKREDNTNGKWNYEGVVKTNGKEWGIEVDPNGKYVGKHGAKHGAAE